MTWPIDHEELVIRPNLRDNFRQLGKIKWSGTSQNWSVIHELILCQYMLRIWTSEQDWYYGLISSRMWPRLIRRLRQRRTTLIVFLIIIFICQFLLWYRRKEKSVKLGNNFIRYKITITCYLNWFKRWFKFSMLLLQITWKPERLHWSTRNSCSGWSLYWRLCGFLENSKHHER